MIDVDGYTAEDPVLDEDWEDEVRWQVNANLRDKRFHDTNGFLCEFAGDPACLALGHKPDPEDGWDNDTDRHPRGWDGDALCLATKYGVACTQCECETDECEYERPNVQAFWKLFAARTPTEPTKGANRG